MTGTSLHTFPDLRAPAPVETPPRLIERKLLPCSRGIAASHPYGTGPGTSSRRRTAGGPDRPLLGRSTPRRRSASSSTPRTPSTSTSEPDRHRATGTTEYHSDQSQRGRLLLLHAPGATGFTPSPPRPRPAATSTPWRASSTPTGVGSPTTTTPTPTPGTASSPTASTPIQPTGSASPITTGRAKARTTCSSRRPPSADTTIPYLPTVYTVASASLNGTDLHLQLYGHNGSDLNYQYHAITVKILDMYGIPIHSGVWYEPFLTSGWLVIGGPPTDKSQVVGLQRWLPQPHPGLPTLGPGVLRLSRPIGSSSPSTRPVTAPSPRRT